MADRGRSEGLLGEAGSMGHLEGIAVDTKILTTSADGKNTLTEPAILESVSSSRKRLSGDSSATVSISTLYCHVFDPVTPLSETNSTLVSLCKSENAFKTLGVSNFSASQIDSFVASCAETTCPNPAVFRGLYNALSRNAERPLAHSPDVPSLLSAVRKHSVSYIAWYPLAGGFLTGKFTRGESQGTHLAGDDGQFHRMLYDKPQMHAAVKMLDDIYGSEVEGAEGENADITPLAEASLRWLYWHSALGEHDGIILGASTLDMIQANCAAIKRGLLPTSLVDAFDKAWRMVENDAPQF